MHIHNGYEYLFEEMLITAEKNIADNDGNLTVLSLKSQNYREKVLLKHGYIKNENIEEIGFFKRAKCDKERKINLKDGFELIVGTKNLNHIKKTKRI